MAGGGRAFSYLISAQVQAVTLILMAFWVGDWLNERYPKDFNWYLVTFAVAVISIFQTFYVVIRATLKIGKEAEKKNID